MKTATELEKLFHPIEGYVKLSPNLKKKKKKEYARMRQNIMNTGIYT